jgi:branched-chain amino acid aminotransferase
MKAYKTADGEIRLFRPDCNMERLNSSMERIALPNFDGDAFMECLKELIKLDHEWIPQEEGYSMYIRPTAIGNSPYLGLTAPNHAKLYAILSPVGPYYPDGFKPVRLLADTENVRAWPGGVGAAKVGGNYGPTVKPGNDAVAKGYQQVLWLFGEDHQVCEIGAMNMFFVLKTKDGQTEVVTPPLTRGDILPGVTRRSILELARDTGKYVVSERAITMSEVREAWTEGRLLEAFGAGTAAIISPVNCIAYEGVDMDIPTGESIGPVSESFWRMLCDIQYGIKEHPWSIKVPH